MGEMYSSYGVIMAFRNNYWFPIIVPIVAAILYINRFHDEWLTGYYYMRIHCSKRIFYAVENVFMAAFTGFLVMCTGILLFGMITSVFSCIMLTIVRDCFLSLTLPMMLMYLCTKVCNYYTLFVRQHYADDPPLAVDMLRLLIPSMYMDMEWVFHQWFGVPDILWHVYLLAILGFLAVIMICIVKGRDV